MNPIAPGHSGPPRVVKDVVPGPGTRGVGARAVSADLRADGSPASEQPRAEPRVRRLSAAGLAQVNALLTYTCNASPRTGGPCGHQVDLYA